MSTITHVKNAIRDFKAITEFIEHTPTENFNNSFKALTSDVATVAMLTRFDLESDPQPDLGIQTTMITEPDIIHSDQSLTVMLFLDSTQCDIYDTSDLVMNVKSESNTMIVMDHGFRAQTTGAGRVLVIKLTNIITQVTGRQ